MQQLLSRGEVIYAYADEATFYRSGQEYVGAGIFMTNKPIAIEVIRNALAQLKADEELIPKQDGRTLSRGYFHACEDTKNGHSYICRAIVGSLNGLFSYAHIKKEANSKRSYEQLYRLTTQLLMGKFLDLGCPVIMHCEQRVGFSQFFTEKFLADYFSYIDRVAVEHPSIINKYPGISIIIADKTNSGIQVCDFILWANNREMMLPSEPTWKNRLKMPMLRKVNYQDLSQYSGEYGLGDFSWAMEVNDLFCSPYAVPQEIPNPQRSLTDYYQNIEQTILALSQPLATHVESLLNQARCSLIVQEFKNLALA